MSERPFRLLQRDINTVRKGEDPSLDLKTLLQITGLGEPTPRDCAFLFRFCGEGAIIGKVALGLGLYRLEYSLDEMANRVFARSSNPQEDILAQRLVGLATAQIISGSSICPLVKELRQSTIELRPDLVRGAKNELLALENPPAYLSPHLVRTVMFGGLA